MIWISDRLSKPGSDFQGKLRYWLMGHIPHDGDGYIALVRDFGEIVGWARTETWRGMRTLEAFVAEAYRGRGIATLATMALRAAAAIPGEPPAQVAVFTSRSMIPVASRAGLSPVFFVKSGSGEWVKA